MVQHVDAVKQHALAGSTVDEVCTVRKQPAWHVTTGMVSTAVVRDGVANDGSPMIWSHFGGQNSVSRSHAAHGKHIPLEQ